MPAIALVSSLLLLKHSAELTVNNAKTRSLLSLALPALHLCISLNIQQGTLLESQNEIPSCASLDKGSDSPPRSVSVILWSAGRRQRVLDDLVAGAGSSQLWAGGEVADELDLGEWAWSGGGECAKGGWLVGSAENLAGEHDDGLFNRSLGLRVVVVGSEDWIVGLSRGGL